MPLTPRRTIPSPSPPLALNRIHYPAERDDPEKRGLQLFEREAGNFILPAYPGLIAKDSYWRWSERNLAGNAIDFCVHDLGLSFHDAMRRITGS